MKLIPELLLLIFLIGSSSQMRRNYESQSEELIKRFDKSIPPCQNLKNSFESDARSSSTVSKLAQGSKKIQLNAKDEPDVGSRRKFSKTSSWQVDVTSLKEKFEEKLARILPNSPWGEREKRKRIEAERSRKKIQEMEKKRKAEEKRDAEWTNMILRDSPFKLE